MSENLIINGYTCKTQEIYDTLLSENISVSALKSLDKNSDKIITEDEYQEFTEENDNKEDKKTVSKTGASSSDTSTVNENPEIAELRRKYEKEQNAILKQRLRLKNFKKSKSKAEAQLNSYAQGSDGESSVLKRIENIEEKISKANSEIATHSKNLKSISNSIQAKLNDISNTTSNISATGSVSGVSGSTSASQTTTIPQELANRLDSKLGSGFAAKCEEVASKLKCNPNDLLAMMYSESGIDPNCVGYNGACGLIMFMPSTLSGNGYSQSQVANMSGVEQLDVVYDIMSKSKALAGFSDSDTLDAGSLYAINFLPAFAKKDNLCSAGDIYYNTNYPLDLDGDGHISKSDLAQRLQNKYDELNQWF